jgi:hypothetical protein
MLTKQILTCMCIGHGALTHTHMHVCVGECACTHTTNEQLQIIYGSLISSYDNEA